MKITYIYHSGFVIETDNYAIIVDFFKDTENHTQGYINEYVLKRPGPLYVLASHVHPDHFNPLVMSWQKQHPDIRYILSKDILDAGKAKQDDATFLNKGETYKDDSLLVKAYGSTDAGISFMIETGGKTIFHAGDLNNWHWKDESTPEEIKESEDAYLKELDDIYKDHKQIDVVMFPVDPRLGTDYMLGAKQFIDKIKTGILIPMHFSENYDEIATFKPYAESKETNFIELTHKGQSIQL